MPPSNVLNEMLQSLGRLSTSPVKQEMVTLLQEWAEYFGASVADLKDKIGAWAGQLYVLLDGPDRKTELELLALARLNPLLGITLILSALPGTASRCALRWFTSFFVEQGKDSELPGWTIKRLPAPAPGGPKYLILSDAHRDLVSDYKGKLTIGSIDHFRSNAQLYSDVLAHAITNHYTVIEAGDCEELWYVGDLAGYPTQPDGTLDVAKHLSDIVHDHQAIYDQLCALDADGRYIRIQGNHDSFVRYNDTDDSVGQVLRTTMQNPAFTVYDGCMIEGIKTMMEPDVLGLLRDAASLAASGKAEQLGERLLRGRLGLDSGAYTDTCKMLIAHGHQWDFWNSAENEILGLLITNTVAIFVDQHMDPFLDLRGISWAGNPLIDFGDLFTRLPIFNSWLDKQAAVRFAHQVQHMPNHDRVLQDSVVFSESLVALWAGFGMALNWRAPDGKVVTAEDSRKELDLRTHTGIAEYLGRHHFHHICIGHTHNPQSQPFLTLTNLGDLIPPLKPLTGLLQRLLPGFLQPQFKTTYFNSGTGGWMEGVIWAIRIDGDGQAHLIYWTQNSKAPELMDWELTALDNDVKQHLREGLALALQLPVNELNQHVENLVKLIRQRLIDLKIAVEEQVAVFAQAVAAPIHLLALALMDKARSVIRRYGLFELSQEIRNGARQAIDKALDELNRRLLDVRTFMHDVMLSVKRRALRGFVLDTDVDYYIATLEISDPAKLSLNRFASILRAMGTVEDAVLHVAGLAFAGFNEFPSSLPFFSSMAASLNPAARLRDSAAPVLQSLLSTLWMYPPFNEPITIRGVAVRSTFKLDGSQIKLIVALSKAGGPVPQRDPDAPAAPAVA